MNASSLCAGVTRTRGEEAAVLPVISHAGIAFDIDAAHHSVISKAC
jgi:hypothetical protein